MTSSLKPKKRAMAKTSRSKKSSALNDLIDLLALLPWWLCTALAVVSFIYLHSLDVSVRVSQTANASQVAVMVQKELLAGLVVAGQYVVPILFLTAAGLSFFARQHRKSLLRDVEQARCAQSLNDMTWREFEMLVGEAFRTQGYAIKDMGGIGPDGGIDVVLTKGGEKFLVQCKQWKALKVSVEIVRELFGVMAATGATGAYVVTSGRFTEPARSFAQGRNITLIDGAKLFTMIQQASSVADTAPSMLSARSTVPAAHPAPKPTQANHQQSAVSCPVCGSAMVERTARTGANAGGKFWGCSRFPVCRGMRNAR